MSKQRKGLNTPKVPSAYLTEYDDLTFQDYNPPKTGYKRCHETHPELELGAGRILGASCLYPKKGYDIYIGLDAGMEFLGGSYPWQKTTKGPVEFLFKIQDMSVPTNPAEFKKMVTWMEEQLTLGKSIHIGCIGGHGRTGLVLAALIKQMLGDEDATTWVRTHYCKKAVESSEQVEFLHKHYGIKRVDASKGYGGQSSFGANWGRASNGSTRKLPGVKPQDVKKQGITLHRCVKTKASIWA